MPYNDMYTNETAFHRNKEKSFILGQCIFHLVHNIAFILKIPKYPFLKCKVKLFIVVIFLYVDVRDGVKTLKHVTSNIWVINAIISALFLLRRFEII